LRAITPSEGDGVGRHVIEKRGKSMERLLVSAAVLGLLSSAPAFAAGPTASVNTGADATVVAPIGITNVLNDVTTKLSFGQIAANTTAGHVNISSAGVLSSPDVPTLIAPGSTGSVPTFTVTGSPGLAYTGTVASTVNLTGPGTTMVATLTQVGGTGNLDATGKATFTLSASLAVGANQTPGPYSGTFATTASYN
jgi:hypothetical protein